MLTESSNIWIYPDPSLTGALIRSDFRQTTSFFRKAIYCCFYNLVHWYLTVNTTWQWSCKSFEKEKWIQFPIWICLCDGLKSFVTTVTATFTKSTYWSKLQDVLGHSPFMRQPHKMVKHIQTIHWQQPTNCLSVFEQFVGLELKGLTPFRNNLYRKCCLYEEFSKLLWH